MLWKRNQLASTQGKMSKLKTRDKHSGAELISDEEMVPGSHGLSTIWLAMRTLHLNAAVCGNQIKPAWDMEQGWGQAKTKVHVCISYNFLHLIFYLGSFLLKASEWRKWPKKKLCTSVYVFRKRIFELGISPWESLQDRIQPTKHTVRVLIRKFQVRSLPRDVSFSKNYLWLYFTFDLLPLVHKRNKRTIVQY